eukprot:1961718-Alexandrium_andersonii.AAC.1
MCTPLAARKPQGQCNHISHGPTADPAQDHVDPRLSSNNVQNGPLAATEPNARPNARTPILWPFSQTVAPRASEPP